jgi:prophage regulatory protein
MHKTLLRLPAVKARTGLCRSGIYLAMKNGTFPTPVKISERCIAWPDADIEYWIEARTTASKSRLKARSAAMKGGAK